MATPPRRDTKAYSLTLVRRLYDELLNRAYFTRIERVQEIIGPDFVDRGPNSPPMGRGPEAFAACNEMLAAIPGAGRARWTMEDVIAERNRVVVRWSCRKGRFTSAGITIYTISRGLISAAYTLWDSSAIARAGISLPLQGE